MSGIHITENGLYRRPDSSKIVSCKFRGKNVECTIAECEADYCKVCGWNPLVEAKRKVALRVTA